MTSSSTSHRGSEHWTNENRTRYDRSGLRYPSDLTDEEWAHVEPLIPPVTRGGNKRTVNTPGRRARQQDAQDCGW
jgi:hypothetical protein